MRKLFKMDTSVLIDNYSSIRITGPYDLVKLSGTACTIRSENFVIDMTGQEIVIETLAEEVAVITFETLEKMMIQPGKGKDDAYDS
ncbi:hypothetical protein NCCP2222_02780 [Sporosarcina sp. NCCP-2222]|uniref:hypothetical protein n=1 Tax=Sporosarcina TaxID=1569 RepID=UPI001EDE8812|nr:MULTISPECIES: hypothetical protein [Sporosarcina]MCG3089107.1 hypothetical protein [Sporosarcina cyprini]GKV54331.1 hypothetical protein NCCP2222_02780 [Sporosarcina sp. NCCP-2222]